MRPLCVYCKYHKCGKEKEQDCTCGIKRQAIEDWYVACNALFKDRRENGKMWNGFERRRPARLMAVG